MLTQTNNKAFLETVVRLVLTWHLTGTHLLLQ